MHTCASNKQEEEESYRLKARMRSSAHPQDRTPDVSRAPARQGIVNRRKKTGWAQHMSWLPDLCDGWVH